VGSAEVREEASVDPGAVIIIGAGPAGLTAAYELTKHKVQPVVLEADSVVGGIARTVERDGYRFDIGGHRFFTKVARVEQLWRELLAPDDFLHRSRLSRIHYRGKTFSYPLRAFNALRGLGVVEALRCVGSYGWARLHPPADQSHFEGWTQARFGRRLYEIFFKTYTEKVWGVPASEIQADWAAQRIKNLSLMKAIINSMKPGGGSDVTSLIEEFDYPRLGPGMMWESAADRVRAAGGSIHFDSPVIAIEHRGGRARAVRYRHGGKDHRLPADHIISSMPLAELISAMVPSAPADVHAAAAALRYRDFLTVALVIDRQAAFPDNWIYIHDPGVQVGRIQNFGSWSPDMVPHSGKTCLGLEYFVNETDPLWRRTDADLVAMATREIAQLKLAQGEAVERGYVVRMRKAYPVYDAGYGENVARIRDWLEHVAANVRPVGRNGMHRYNNQDHSMLTAMLSVENILGADHDVWSVNVDEEYHETAAVAKADAEPGREAT
jgi:protoporphyrinogen oxidase